MSGGSAASSLGIGLRVGMEMVSALVVAVAIGWGLDRLLGTRPILLAVFVLLGGAAGVLNVWRMFAPRSRHGGLTRTAASTGRGTTTWRPDQSIDALGQFSCIPRWGRSAPR